MRRASSDKTTEPGLATADSWDRMDLSLHRYHCACKPDASHPGRSMLLPAFPGVKRMAKDAVTIPASMTGRVIGSGGENVKRLSEEYSVLIDIPRPEQITGDQVSDSAACLVC